MHLFLFFALFVVYLLFHYQKKQNKKYEIIAMGTVLFLFAALRKSNVGIDVATYFQYYTKCINIEFIDFFNPTLQGAFYERDTLFYLLLKLLSFVSTDPQLMLVVIGAWSAFTFSYLVYNQKANSFVLFTLFITFRLFAFTLTGLRETVALGFVFIAIVQLQKRHYIGSIILTIIGAFFHLSALSFILAIILSLVKNSKLVFITALTFFFINLLGNNSLIYFLSKVFLGGRYLSYGENALFNTMEFSLTSFIYFCFLIFILLFSKKSLDHNKNKYIDYNILIFGVMFSLIGQSVDNLFRVSYYFMPLLYSNIDESLSTVFEKKSLSIIRILICGLLIIQYILLKPGAGISDYYFFWN